MHDVGHFILQSLNFVKAGLLVGGLEVILVGDRIQQFPRRQRDIWKSGLWISSSSFAARML